MKEKKEIKEAKHNSESNMKLAFFLNLLFTVIEIIGGIFTNSISILSDAIHDLGDSLSIGISIILEKIAKKKPDKKYTYGYARYSILGALINLCVLLIGTTIVLFTAIPRLFNPQEVNHEGMFILAILGILINGIGVLKTIKTDKISEKVISLHLLEDVLGWIAVLIVSVCIKIFNLPILDPILSLGISIFILYNVFKNAKKILDIILEKVPNNINTEDIKTEILKNNKISEMHHIHVWTMDGSTNYLTAHIVIKEKMDIEEIIKLKNEVKHELEHLKIHHSTLEIELEDEKCTEEECDVKVEFKHDHGHQH